MNCFMIRFIFIDVVLILFLGRSCYGQNCSIGDILAMDIMELNIEKLDGHWYVEKEFKMAEEGEFTSYTVDVVPTSTGITLYFSRNKTADTVCDYEAIELNSTSDTSLFSTSSNKGTGNAHTVVVAAADDDYALLYICEDIARAKSDRCGEARAVLMGRRFNPVTATAWLSSLSSSLPCFGNVSGVTNVHQDTVCPLKTMWKLPGRNCTVSSFPVQPNFSLTKYVSRVWREMAWLAPSYLDPSTFYQDYLHDYSLEANGSITCDVAGRNPADMNKCFFYQLILNTTGTPGKLILYDKNGPIPYNVIHVDYDHYAVVFGCYDQTSEGECNKARSWLWSRDVTLARQYRLAANTVIQNLCANPAAMLQTEHKNACIKDTGEGRRLTSALTLTAVMSLLAVSSIM